jgi:transketolase
VILIANGSEVSTCEEACQKLLEYGVHSRLVSVPSEGLFKAQDQLYQNEVLPRGIKKFGLTAGLPINLEGLVGSDGKVYGLSHFGYSAPYQVLDEKFGFTSDNVVQQVLKLIGK